MQVLRRTGAEYDDNFQPCCLKLRGGFPNVDIDTASAPEEFVLEVIEADNLNDTGK